MRRGERAFTLLELLIVISIIGILATLSQPTYQTHLIRAREAALRQQLHEVRSAIDQFHADRGAFPESLEALAEAEYLPRVPPDPVTRQPDWIRIPPPPPETGGLADIRSSSDLVSLNGTPYNEW